MEEQRSSIKLLWQTWKIVSVFAILKLLIHFLANTNYGFHRDEYFSLALGRHLAWGYIQVLPVIAIPGKSALGLGVDLFIVNFQLTYSIQIFHVNIAYIK